MEKTDMGDSINFIIRDFKPYLVTIYSKTYWYVPGVGYELYTK